MSLFSPAILAVSCSDSTYPACGGDCTSSYQYCNKTISYDANDTNCLCDCPIYSQAVLNLSNSTLAGSGFSIRYNDNDETSGKVFVINSSGSVVSNAIQIGEGNYYQFSYQGRTYTFRLVRSVATSSGFARVATYNKEITLEDGNRYDYVPSSDPNYNYKVSLIWKNKEGSSSSSVADSLREAVLYDEDTFIARKYTSGNSYNLKATSPNYNLVYNGLDLADSEYTPVAISSLSSLDYAVSNATNGGDCTDIRNRWTYTARFVQFSAPSAIFGGANINLLGSEIYSQFFYDPIGQSSNANTSNLNGTQNWARPLNMWQPIILYRPAGYTCYIYKSVSAGTPPSGAAVPLSSTNSVYASSAGSDSSAYGQFYFGKFAANTSGFNASAFYYLEDAGINDTVSHTHVFLKMPLIQSIDTWRFKARDTSASNAFYHGIRDSAYQWNSYEPLLITERGSRVTSIGTTDYSLRIANRVGNAKFTFDSSHVFKTLITDTIDKTLSNRINTRSEDNYTDGMSTSDTSTILSPLRAVYTGTTAKNLYRIGASQYSGFADYSTTDPISNSAYTELQSFWVGSSADAVLYDSGSSYRQIIAKPKIAAYSLKFIGNDFGIPECTVSDGNGDWSACANNADRSDRHRIPVRFMKENWIISKLDNMGTGALPSSTGATSGGVLKLAQESNYQSSLRVGQIISGTTFKFRLVSINSDGSCTFDVLDSSNNVIGQITVQAGSTYTFTDSQGRSDKIHLYNSGNVSTSEKYAEFRTYQTCALNKTLNLANCSCVCANQTAKTACTNAGNRWNESDCTCKLQNLTCEQSSVPACSASCTNTNEACKNFNNSMCGCLCPNITRYQYSNLTVIPGTYSITFYGLRINYSWNGSGNINVRISDTNSRLLYDGYLYSGLYKYGLNTQNSKRVKVEVKSITYNGNRAYVSLLGWEDPCPSGYQLNETTCACQNAAQNLTCNQTTYPTCGGNCTNSRNVCDPIKGACECDCPAIASGNISIGGILDAGAAKVRLADLTRNGDAIIDILDSNDHLVKQVMILRGETRQVLHFAGSIVVIKIVDSLLTSDLSQKWAEIRIYAVCGEGYYYDFTSCACVANSAATCGIGTDAKICSKNCTDSRKECIDNQSADCSCECKAIMRDTINIGGRLYAGDYSFKLADIDNANKEAIVDVLDANDVVIAQYSQSLGSVRVYYNQNTGQTITFKIEKIGFGATLSAKWATISIMPSCSPDEYYNFTTCSCQPLPGYCGQGADANACTLSCQNTKKDCIINNKEGCDCDCKANSTIINYGESLFGYGLIFRLADLEYGSGNALIQILNENSLQFEEVKLSPGQYYTVVDPLTGRKVTFKLVRSAMGNTLNAKWAELRVYPTCPDGSQYNTSTCSCQAVNLTCDQAIYPACFGACINNAKQCMNVSNSTQLNQCSCQCPQASDYITGVSEKKIITLPGGLGARLVDISVGQGNSSTHPAIFDIIGTDGKVIGQATVDIEQVYTYYDPITGKSITIKVLRTAPGFTLNAKWADFLIYSPCPDGKVFNETICACECANQTAKQYCIENKGIWNDNNCSCTQSCEQSSHPVCSGACKNSAKTCMVDANDTCGCGCKSIPDNVKSVEISSGGVILPGYRIFIEPTGKTDANGEPIVLVEFLDNNNKLVDSAEMGAGSHHVFIDPVSKRSVSFRLLSVDLSLGSMNVRLFQCPPNKLFNEETCQCECANQTAKQECISNKGIWNDNNCSCTQSCEQSYPVCTSQCANGNHKCNVLDSFGCGCACPQEGVQILNVTEGLDYGEFKIVGYSLTVGSDGKFKEVTFVLNLSSGGLDTVRVSPGQEFTYERNGVKAKFRLISLYPSDPSSNEPFRIAISKPPACPEGKEWNDVYCFCECSNKTAKAACKYPDKWNDNTCACEKVEFCGKGSDAGICDKKCQIETFDCELNSSDGNCSCDCNLNPATCVSPKTANDALCKCICPAQSEGTIKVGSRLPGANFDYEVSAIDSSTDPPRVHIKIYRKDGTYVWEYWLPAGAELSYFVDWKDMRYSNFKIGSVNPSNGETSIILMSDRCPLKKMYDDNTCNCTCNQNERWVCEGKGGAWNETDCSCAFIPCAYNDSAQVCDGNCSNKLHSCQPPQPVPIIVSKLNISVCKPWLSDVPIASYLNASLMATAPNLEPFDPSCISINPIVLDDINCSCSCSNTQERLDCLKNKDIWNDTTCTCAYNERLCSKGERYPNNNSCGRDDCGADSQCNPVNCTCEPKPCQEVIVVTKTTGGYATTGGATSPYASAALAAPLTTAPVKCMPILAPIDVAGLFTIPAIYVGDSGCNGNGCNLATEYCNAQTIPASDLAENPILAPITNPRLIAKSCAGACPPGLTCKISDSSACTCLPASEPLCSAQARWPNNTCGMDDCKTAVGQNYRCNATACKCEIVPEGAKACSKGERYSNNSCGADDCKQALGNGWICDQSACVCVEMPKFCSMGGMYSNGSCGADDCSIKGAGWACNPSTCTCSQAAPKFCGDSSDAGVCKVACMNANQTCSKPYGACQCICPGGQLIILGPGKQDLYSQYLGALGEFSVRNENVGSDGTVTLGLRQGNNYDSAKLIETKSGKTGDLITFTASDGTSITVKIVKADGSSGTAYLYLYPCESGVYDYDACACVPKSKAQGDGGFGYWYQ